MPLTVLAVIAFAGAYAGYWYYAKGALHDGVDLWIAQRRAEGIDVRVGALSITGFPFALDAEARDVVAAQAGGRVAWEGRVPILHMVGAPWDFRRLAFATGGPAELIVVNIVTGQRAAITAARGEGSAAFEASGRLRFRELRLYKIGAEGSEPFLPMTAAVADFGVNQREPDAVEVSLRAVDMTMPPLPGPQLGQSLQTLAATIVWQGAIPSLPTQSALAAWRANGGRVDIRFLEAVWGPLGFTASGEARLDADLQPTGTLSTTTQGYREAVNAIEAAGQMSPRQAAQTRLMLDLMATRPGNGGPPQLDVDLNLVDRRLSAGALPLAVLPRIDWPLR
ncbi:MAG: DUF2125 domain-containing protein [Alphaproteobacteria bacterium]|nr:DUF2125 domain-containing protein [Alphaproteobacteria bacterium]